MPTFANVSYTSLTVSWPAARDAAAYEVERAPDVSGSAGTYAQVASGVSGTSFDDTGLAPATKYWYRVRGTNAYGVGPYSGATTTSTLTLTPGAPGTPTYAATQTSITLSWTAARDATSYVIERLPCVGTSCWYVEIARGITATSYEDAGLTPGTYYQYRVRGTNAYGDGAPASINNAYTSTYVPANVSQPKFSNVAPTTLTLSWTAATGADSYKVRRGVGSSPTTWTDVATALTALSFDDSGLSPGTTYSYRVVGTNSYGDGTGTAQQVTTPPLQPASIMYPTSCGQTDTTITVCWDAAARATSYKVERAANTFDPSGYPMAATPYTEIAAGVVGTSFVDSGLAPNTIYWYIVRATNEFGDSGYSLAAKLRTLPGGPVPAAPAAPRVTKIGSTAFRIEWDAVEGATSYALQWSDYSTYPYESPSNPGSNTGFANGITGLSYTVTGLPAPSSQYETKTYPFRVLAKNAYGDGPWSPATPGLVTGAGAAYYDPSLKAPRCTDVGSCSYSAPYRSYSEENAPNTVDDSCADDGVYEYPSAAVSSIAVSAGRAGTWATVRVTVADASANDVVSVYTGTLREDASGHVVEFGPECPVTSAPPGYTYNYTCTFLPSAGTQVIRASVRDGAGGVCASPAAGDSDDLVFAVAPAYADTTLPTVTLDAPANGAFVTGPITVQATGRDNLYLQSLAILVDGVQVAFAPQSGSYSRVLTAQWTPASSGPHTITAKATDSVGNVAIQSVTVTADVDVPQVAVTSPANGAVVKSIVTISATASDSTLQSVALSVDGVLLETIAAPGPYTATWDSRKKSGTHVFSAVATDLAGRTATSQVTVTAK